VGEIAGQQLRTCIGQREKDCVPLGERERVVAMTDCYPILSGNDFDLWISRRQDRAPVQGPTDRFHHGDEDEEVHQQSGFINTPLQAQLHLVVVAVKLLAAAVGKGQEVSRGEAKRVFFEPEAEVCQRFASLQKL